MFITPFNSRWRSHTEKSIYAAYSMYVHIMSHYGPNALWMVIYTLFNFCHFTHYTTPSTRQAAGSHFGSEEICMPTMAERKGLPILAMVVPNNGFPPVFIRYKQCKAHPINVTDWQRVGHIHYIKWQCSSSGWWACRRLYLRALGPNGTLDWTGSFSCSCSAVGCAQ